MKIARFGKILFAICMGGTLCSGVILVFRGGHVFCERLVTMATKTKDRPSIKNDEQYEALRDKGMSQEKAARIANAKSKDMDYDSTPYEERTREELYQKAKEVGIEGRSKMDKAGLIEALRNH